jgi:hypothetical protein
VNCNPLGPRSVNVRSEVSVNVSLSTKTVADESRKGFAYFLVLLSAKNLNIFLLDTKEK